MLNKIAVFLLRLYKITISQYLSKKIACRFYPTCSDYAILCYQKFSFFEATKKTVYRLRRCNSSNLDTCIDYPKPKI